MAGARQGLALSLHCHITNSGVILSYNRGRKPKKEQTEKVHLQTSKE